MNEKSYNMYLKMLKLACRNVRAAICQENGITDTSQVQVKIRDRDGLVNIVAAIVSTPDSADTIYATRVERRLVIVSDVTILHQINAASVFIKSILKSRSARICQKQMVNYLMAERYLDAAWDYDMQNKTEDGSMPNVEYAKSVIIDSDSLNFIGGFLLTERPRIEPTILNGLKTQAFDERYSLMTEEQNAKIAQMSAQDLQDESTAELEKYCGKEATPAKMKEQIMTLLDEWKEKQPPELAKAPKKMEQDK